VAAKPSLTGSRIAALVESISRRPAPARTGPLDALLVSSLPNIRYLSAFTGSNGLLVVSPSGTLLITDPRYTLQAAQEVPFPVRIAKGSLITPVAELAGRKKWRLLGFERNRLSFETWDTLRQSLPATCELVPVDGAVEELRMKKGDDEIARIRQSVDTNSRKSITSRAARARKLPPLKPSWLPVRVARSRMPAPLPPRSPQPESCSSTWAPWKAVMPAT
jgi:hypothetical protein